MKQIGKIIVGWFGGNYEDSGLFDTKEDAERGYMCDDRLYNIFDQYEGMKIKVTIEVIEE